MNDNGKKLVTLGIEGGGTKTTWVLLDEKFHTLAEGKCGPGNYNLIGLTGTVKLLKEIAKALPQKPDRIGICMAGCHLDNQKRAIESEAKKIWSKANPIIAGEDTKSGYYGAHGNADGIMVISGTGSNTLGKKGSTFLKAGGYGHIFSDEGSAYRIAVHGFEQAFKEYDRTGKVSPLAKEFLRIANANSLLDLVPIIFANPNKDYIASYALPVALLAEKGDKLAQSVLKQSADELAENVGIVAKRLKLKKPPVALVGSMLEKRPNYLALFKKAVRKHLDVADIFVSTTPGAVGAASFVLNQKISLPAELKKKALK